MSERLEIPAVLLVLGCRNDFVAEVQAGLEEEGVPCRLLPHQPMVELHQSSHQAALDSPLGVGVACDRQHACLHFHRLPPLQPYYYRVLQTAAEWRLLGQDAARLVKGIPLFIPGAQAQSQNIGAHYELDL